MRGKLGLALIAGLTVCLAGRGGKKKRPRKKPRERERPGHSWLCRPTRSSCASRSGKVVPERDKNAQTGSGYIDVVQRDPATIMIIMRGAVVAGSETHKGGQAAMHFLLDQTFDIVPTRDGLLPPRLLATSMLTGILDSTYPHGGTPSKVRPASPFSWVASRSSPLASSHMRWSHARICS